ncbi:MAG: LptA/OstA family protein [Acidobacteriota bacterium]
MRLTIERLRTLILAAGILLIATLVVFLVVAHWKSRFIVHEIPKRLGADIKQEANGITYTQSRHGHTLFKIHASREVQLENSGRVILHDVHIELYGPDGKGLDRISGGEFEYDQKAGLATAAGPVEILLTRPTAAAPASLGTSAQDKAINSALKNVAQAAGPGDIDVKTSGLTFDQKSGIATTRQQVEFTSVQGHGSAVGATFDSQAGTLLLNHNVSLNVHRNAENVALRAQSASFDRDQLLCRMRNASADYQGGSAAAGEAQVLFRPDGSAARLDARDGFTLSTREQSKVSSPQGWLVFNAKSQPQHGFMFGGVTIQSQSSGRSTRGTAPTADLDFTAAGELRHARMERGVAIHSEQSGQQGAIVVRDWSSPVVDLDFHKAGGGPIVLSGLRGQGGVVITSAMRQGTAVEAPSRMAADAMLADFGPHQELRHVIGTGHASLDETTASGARQTISGDRLDARFGAQRTHPANFSAAIESALVDGHVILTDQPANKGGQPQPAVKATSAHAVYDGKTEWLHLTGAPRIENGGFEMTADRVDVSQAGGDALAHGNVKGTWEGGSDGRGITLGGQGPAHLVAAEAQMNRASGEATFRGHARLWQQANSISAPVIVLNQTRQTLAAHSSADQPVQLVMLSTPASGRAGARSQLVQVRSGDLKYSEAERKAVLRRNVVAETATATISSDQAEILLQPQGSHAASAGAPAQVERVTARHHVQIVSQGRRGVGEMLVYTAATGTYVLTGTPAEPPTLTDPVRGVVRGAALIFNGRDDSVSIEGGGRKTTTQTVAPR